MGKRRGFDFNHPGKSGKKSKGSRAISAPASASDNPRTEEAVDAIRNEIRETGEAGTAAGDPWGDPWSVAGWMGRAARRARSPAAMGDHAAIAMMGAESGTEH
ncbi:MAG TPA: hypothetical protein VL285_08800 [Bryobacteraceae bacterium]|nr:hypothetical protein [Bryobacteraceae bacterium]